MTARADSGCAEGNVVVGADDSDQATEPVDLRRKLAGDLAFEDGEIVGERERHLAARTEGDAGALLFAEGELVALDAKLAKELGERRALHAGAHEVRHRVEPHVVFAPVDAVETVESARDVVPLEDAHLFAEVRETDAGRESGHARADDGNVVVGGGVHSVFIWKAGKRV